MRWEYHHTVWLVMLFGWLILYANRMILSPIFLIVASVLALMVKPAFKAEPEIPIKLPSRKPF